MGIRGLETFLESREDHNCTRHVYIAELAAEFRYYIKSSVNNPRLIQCFIMYL